MPDDAIERAVRIAVWNVAKSRGMADDVIYDLINKTISEPTLAKALAFASQQAPEGWKFVPTGEPTQAMWNAAWEASEDYFVGDDVTQRGFRLGLSAMLDAAPSVTLGEVG